MSKSNQNLWYGFRDMNGDIHLEPYSGPRDMERAHENSFVFAVHRPFRASERSFAWDHLERVLPRRAA